MANSTISNPNIMPSYSADNPGTGTSQVSCTQCHQIRFGKMVFLSARLKVNSAITSSAMDTPLLKLSVNVPDYNTQQTVPVPSIVRVAGNIYADLISLKVVNGQWYVTQKISSGLAANDSVDFFIAYQTI